MATFIDRVELRDVVPAGITAGVIFAAFETIATALVSGPAAATMPIRMIGAMVLGPRALEPNYSLALAGITGLVVHLLLSIVFAGIFAVIVARIADATLGELLTSTGQLALAGTIFGMALWLVNFHVIAPL